MKETLKDLIVKMEKLQDDIKEKYKELSAKYGYELKK